MNIKAKIKLIGNEQIYGAPVLNIVGPVGTYSWSKSITTWQFTRTNQVLKGFHDDEFRWILPGDEFNFDVNWKWDDAEIPPGTYETQVYWFTPNEGRRVFGMVSTVDRKVQLEDETSWIPIPTSISPGLSSYSATITVFSIILIVSAIMYLGTVFFKTPNGGGQKIIQQIYGIVYKLGNNKFVLKSIESRNTLLKISLIIKATAYFATSIFKELARRRNMINEDKQVISQINRPIIEIESKELNINLLKKKLILENQILLKIQVFLLPLFSNKRTRDKKIIQKIDILIGELKNNDLKREIFNEKLNEILKELEK